MPQFGNTQVQGSSFSPTPISENRGAGSAVTLSAIADLGRIASGIATNVFEQEAKQNAAAQEAKLESQRNSTLAQFQRDLNAISDARAQGKYRTASAATGAFRRKFTEALNANPDLQEDIRKIYGSATGNTTVGGIVTEEDRFEKMVREDGLVPNEELVEEYKQRDSAAKKLESASKQLAFTLQQQAVQKGEIALSQAEREEKAELARRTQLRALQDYADSEMSVVKSKIDKILADGGENTLELIAEEELKYKQAIAQIPASVLEENPGLTAPFELIFRESKKFGSPEYDASKFQQYLRGIQKARAVDLFNGPNGKQARDLYANSLLFANLTQGLNVRNIPVVNQIFNGTMIPPKDGGGEQTAAGFDALTTALGNYNTNGGNESDKMFLENSVGKLLDQAHDYSNGITSVKQTKDAVKMFASPQFGDYLKKSGALGRDAAEKAAGLMATHVDKVMGATAKRLNEPLRATGIAAFDPGRGVVDKPLKDLVEPEMVAGMVRFKFKEGVGNSGANRAALTQVNQTVGRELTKIINAQSNLYLGKKTKEELYKHYVVNFIDKFNQ